VKSTAGSKFFWRNTASYSYSQFNKIRGLFFRQRFRQLLTTTDLTTPRFVIGANKLQTFTIFLLIQSLLHFFVRRWREDLIACTHMTFSKLCGIIILRNGVVAGVLHTAAIMSVALINIFSWSKPFIFLVKTLWSSN